MKVTYILSHTLFYDTLMYLLNLVGLVTEFAHSSRHMNVPCYKFEKNSKQTVKLNLFTYLVDFEGYNLA